MYYGKLLRQIAESVRGLAADIQSGIERISTRIDAATNTYTTEQSKARPNPTINATFRRSQSEIDQEKAQTEREERAENRDHRRLTIEVVALALTTALIAANIGVLGFYALQLQQMKIATEEAAQSADAAIAAVDLQGIQMRQNRLNNARAEWMQDRALKQSAQDAQDAVTASQDAAKRSVAESERILNVQTRPWLDIEVSGVSAQTLEDDPSMERHANESEANHLKFKRRQVTFQFTIHNFGGGPALRQSAAFIGWDMSDFGSIVSPPPIAVACQNEKESLLNHYVSRGIPIFPGQTGPSRPETSEPLFYRTMVVSTIGCVAYQGSSDISTGEIHHSAVRVTCTVGQNKADNKSPDATCGVQSIGAD